MFGGASASVLCSPQRRDFRNGSTMRVSRDEKWLNHAGFRVPKRKPAWLLSLQRVRKWLNHAGLRRSKAIFQALRETQCSCGFQDPLFMRVSEGISWKPLVERARKSSIHACFTRWLSYLLFIRKSQKMAQPCGFAKKKLFFVSKQACFRGSGSANLHVYWQKKVLNFFVQSWSEFQRTNILKLAWLTQEKKLDFSFVIV